MMQVIQTKMCNPELLDHKLLQYLIIKHTMMYRFFETYARNHSYGYINASTMKLPYRYIYHRNCTLSKIQQYHSGHINLTTRTFTQLIYDTFTINKTPVRCYHRLPPNLWVLYNKTEQNTFYLSQTGHYSIVVCANAGALATLYSSLS